MTRRGAAAKTGRVSTVEFSDCGHAPALMDDAQIAVVTDFLFPARPVLPEAAAPIRPPAGSAP